MKSHSKRKRNKQVTILVTDEEYRLIKEAKKISKINMVEMLIMKAKELSYKEGDE